MKLLSLASLLLSVSLARAVITSVSQLEDVPQEAACYESIQSLVERWGVVDERELNLAAADAGKDPGKTPPSYFPDAPLTNRQLAAVLYRMLEMVGPYEKGASGSVESSIAASAKGGRIPAKTAASLREEYRKDVEACLRLQNKAWTKPVSGVKGLEAAAEEYEAMQALLEKYGVGGALLNADGSYTGTKKVTEKALTDFLTHVFKFTPDRDAAGTLTIGMVELNPSAKTVSRGKAACLLESSLSAFEDSLGAANAAADKRLTAAQKPGAAPKPVPAAPPATLNLQQIISGMNAPKLKYKTGAGELVPESSDSLVEIAAYMKRLPAGAVVEIGVHTDSNGNEDSNVKLTQTRADAVKAALTKLGVPAKSLTAKGYGSAKPLAGNDTGEGRVINRRTEFSVRTK